MRRSWSSMSLGARGGARMGTAACLAAFIASSDAAASAASARARSVCIRASRADICCASARSASWTSSALTWATSASTCSLTTVSRMVESCTVSSAERASASATRAAAAVSTADHSSQVGRSASSTSKTRTRASSSAAREMPASMIACSSLWGRRAKVSVEEGGGKLQDPLYSSATPSAPLFGSPVSVLGQPLLTELLRNLAEGCYGLAGLQPQAVQLLLAARQLGLQRPGSCCIRKVCTAAWLQAHRMRRHRGQGSRDKAAGAHQLAPATRPRGPVLVH